MKATVNGVEYTRIVRIETLGDFKISHTCAKAPNGQEILVKWDGVFRSQKAFEKALKKTLSAQIPIEQLLYKPKRS